LHGKFFGAANMAANVMKRFILTILLLISTCAVMAHGVLAYSFNAVQTLIAEEEAPDDKPISKDTKDLGKEKITWLSYPDKYTFTSQLLQPGSAEPLLYSCGFFDTPYNPPELN
jgi:hypothetical protein